MKNIGLYVIGMVLVAVGFNIFFTSNAVDKVLKKVDAVVQLSRPGLPLEEPMPEILEPNEIPAPVQIWPKGNDPAAALKEHIFIDYLMEEISMFIEHVSWEYETPSPVNTANVKAIGLILRNKYGIAWEDYRIRCYLYDKHAVVVEILIVSNADRNLEYSQEWLLEPDEKPVEQLNS